MKMFWRKCAGIILWRTWRYKPFWQQLLTDFRCWIKNPITQTAPARDCDHWLFLQGSGRRADLCSYINFLFCSISLNWKKKTKQLNWLCILQQIFFILISISIPIPKNQMTVFKAWGVQTLNSELKASRCVTDGGSVTECPKPQPSWWTCVGVGAESHSAVLQVLLPATQGNGNHNNR